MPFAISAIKTAVNPPAIEYGKVTKRELTPDSTSASECIWELHYVMMGDLEIDSNAKMAINDLPYGGERARDMMVTMKKKGEWEGNLKFTLLHDAEQRVSLVEHFSLLFLIICCVVHASAAYVDAMEISLLLALGQELPVEFKQFQHFPDVHFLNRKLESAIRSSTLWTDTKALHPRTKKPVLYESPFSRIREYFNDKMKNLIFSLLHPFKKTSCIISWVLKEPVFTCLKVKDLKSKSVLKSCVLGIVYRIPRGRYNIP